MNPFHAVCLPEVNQEPIVRGVFVAVAKARTIAFVPSGSGIGLSLHRARGVHRSIPPREFPLIFECQRCDQEVGPSKQIVFALLEKDEYKEAPKDRLKFLPGLLCPSSVEKA
jgi:hypothetical protein